MTQHSMPKRRWGNEPTELPSTPTIILSSRSQTPDGWAPVPDGRWDITEAHARQHGWATRLTYALADMPATSRCKGYRLATVALRLARGTEVGYAVWESRDDGPWRFAVAYILPTEGGSKLGARELPERLSTQDGAP